MPETFHTNCQTLNKKQRESSRPWAQQVKNRRKNEKFATPVMAYCGISRAGNKCSTATVGGSAIFS